MSEIFLYIFSSIAIISALLSVFSSGNNTARFTIILFILSLCGIITLLHGGYLSVFIAVITAGIYSFKIFIKSLRDNEANTNIISGNQIKHVYVIVIALMGAILASLISAASWQSDIILKKEISILNLKLITASYYYTSFLVVLIFLFLISLLYKPDIPKK